MRTLLLVAFGLALSSQAFAGTDAYEAAWNELEASYKLCLGKDFAGVPFDPPPNHSKDCVRYERAIKAVEAVMGEE